MSKPLIILDRDGVINHDSEFYIRAPEEWHPIDGSLEAVGKLNAAGFRVAVATNQAGVAKGVFTADTLQAIHQKMERSLAAAGAKVDRIFACPHHPDVKCRCRKPEPGMLLDACSHFGVDPAHAIFVGDSLRDLEAARAAGCRPVLVLTGNGAKTRTQVASQFDPLLVFDSLNEFADAAVRGDFA